MTVEGYTNTKNAYEMGRRLGVEMPITNEVYKVLYEGKDIRQAHCRPDGPSPPARIGIHLAAGGKSLPLSRNQKYKKDSPRKKEGSPFLHGRDWQGKQKSCPGNRNSLCVTVLSVR